MKSVRMLLWDFANLIFAHSHEAYRIKHVLNINVLCKFLNNLLKLEIGLKVTLNIISSFFWNLFCSLSLQSVVWHEEQLDKIAREPNVIFYTMIPFGSKTVLSSCSSCHVTLGRDKSKQIAGKLGNAVICYIQPNILF